MKYKFPYKLRLTTNSQFKKVFRSVQKISTELFAVFYCHNSFTHPRLGIVAPKKSIREAHDRNSFKRTVRESFRLRQHELRAIDIVFFAYKKAEQASKEKLCQYLEKQWEEFALRQKKRQL
jgi:ribonuclease P protein component